MRVWWRLAVLLLITNVQGVEASVADSFPSDPEQDRIERAQEELGALASRHAAIAERLDDGVDPGELGRLLWHRASRDARLQPDDAGPVVCGDHSAAPDAGEPGPADDRPLYWTRLAIQRSLAGLGASATERRAFEWASRGMDSIRFPEDDCTRVLLTGFDPFRLDDHIGQSNPSGLAALALDGARLPVRARPVCVEALVLPVRFEDFDSGLVEEVLGPWLGASRPPDLLLTVSMGREQFDLERFPGRRRSAAVADNRNVLTGASPTRPLVPLLDERPLSGPEFLEFSLPAAAMRREGGRWMVRDNRNVVTLERGAMEVADLSELAGQTAVAGSGGGYLSNEVAYRSLRLARELSSPTAVGHLHTPRVAGYQPAVEAGIVAEIRALLIRAVKALAERAP